ncbi:MAG: hypothetical protein ABGY95_09560 [Rubritalea sp.]|uniref:hypothetical protein n=1 Tax=Rubritalea sp. TaxID=2109375 RepID=UPI003241CC98
MRPLLIAPALLLLSILSHAEAPSPAASSSTTVAPADEAKMPAAPFLKTLEKYIQSAYDGAGMTVDIEGVTTVLGLKDLDTIQHSTRQVEDTWLSKISIDRKKLGIFALSAPPSNTPFAAPESTDIAIQAALDLSQLPALLRELHKEIGTPAAAEAFLTQRIAGIEMETFLQSSRPTIHICVDFDDNETLFLGKESIGRPHIALRVDGSHKILEAILNHFISTRNALFKRQVTATGKLYTLPAYFSDAIAGYQPIISFDEIKNTTTIASSISMFERIEDSGNNLTTDSAFTKTWAGFPEESSAKAYISKRALSGLHHFYTLALKEKWTNNRQFLKKKYLITGAMMQLHSSQSGLAFSIASDENSDTITLKSPFPSTMLLWIPRQ